MKLSTNQPGLIVYHDGDGRATLEYRRSCWRWSVERGGCVVARGRERIIKRAREAAMRTLRARSNGKEG